MNKDTSQDMDSALSETGTGLFHLWIVITGGLLLYTSNSDCWSIGYVISSAECEMHLDLYQKSILVTIGSIGMMSTQFLWGYLSDKFGRRNILLYSLLCGWICSASSVFVPEFWMLAMFRFLNGLFISASSGITFAYISEFFAPKHRALAIFIMSILVGFVLILIPLWAWLIIPSQITWEIFGLTLQSWRIYLLISGAPALLALGTLYICPESPKFLLEAGRAEEALIVLQKMHKWNNTLNNSNDFQVKNLDNNDTVEAERKPIDFWELFKISYIVKTILVCVLQIGIFATSCGLFLWYPDILQSLSISEETDKSRDEFTVCEALDLQTPVITNTLNQTIPHDDEFCSEIDNSVYLQNIYIGVAYTFGYMVISALVSKVGIRNLLVCFLGTSGIATFVLLIVTNHHVIFVLFMTLLAFSGICVVVVNAAVVELYPTHMRGMAVCIVMLCGRIGSIIASSLIGYLILWNCRMTFVLFGGSLLGCSILSFGLGFYLRKK